MTDRPAQIRRLAIVGKISPQSITEAAERATLERLRDGPRVTPEMVRDVSRDAGNWCADTVEAVMTMVPPQGPTGCREGCAYCCHLKVIASPIEVLALTAHLRQSLDADGLARVKLRAADTDKLTRGQTTEQRAMARIPCPLLEDGRCLGYAARPLHCAGANAFDAEACHRAFDDPEHAEVPTYGPQHATADAIAAGISRATFGRGLDGSMLELVAGLRVALERDDTAVRWRGGETVFKRAVDPELADLVARSR